MPDLNQQVPAGGIPAVPPSVPMTPPGVPGVPQQGPVTSPIGVAPAAPQEMVSPEQMQELQDILESVKVKLAEVETSRFGQENTSETYRKDALREMFILLQEAGVDLTDPQSVGQFFEAMREKNPQLAQDFEETLQQLLGEEAPVAPEAGPQTPGIPGGVLNNNEINNETLPEDIRGSIPPGPPGGQLI